MCSVQFEESETNGDVLFSSKDMDMEGKLCTKCGLPAVIALRTDDIYCRDCFMIRTTHRFRCEFGKSHLIRDREHVLVAFSGGRNSCAMVHLIMEGLSKRAHKKLRFCPELVYIDDDDSCQWVECSEKQAFLSRILIKLEESGVKYYIFALNQVFDEDLMPIFFSDGSESCFNRDAVTEKLLSADRRRLKTLMQSMTSETSRESLKSLLRKELLVRIARQMQYGKIIIGDNASCLASHLLSSVVQGRGAQIPCEMGFADSRHGDVTFVRPLREFTEKEVDVYNAISNLIPLSTPKNGTDVLSIENLCKQFVSRLQMENGGTLAIICRTGEKLEIPDDDSVKTGNRCPLCQAPTDNVSSSGCASAVNAMAFSHIVCHLLQENSKAKDNCGCESNSAIDSSSLTVKEGADGFKSVTDHHPSVQLLSCFCYGCRITVREMADLQKLPASILEKADNTIRDQMRRGIEEFLLDDNT